MLLQETYNEFLLTKFKQLYSKKELEAALEANERKRPTVIRVNTLKRRPKDLMNDLENRKVELGKIDWYDGCYVAYRSDVPLGATPEYLAGYYIIQGASSVLPVLNLDVKENMKVLDMCSSPGGKTTFISELMNNTGILYANDISKDRIPSLRSNIARMNVQNIIITIMDALDFYVGKLDRVLLDAPCSGTGVISKDPQIKTNKSREEIRELVKMQRKLILHGFDMLNVDGIMVYSTCSVLVDENEEVIDHLLRKRPNARTCDPDVDVGKPGFVKFSGKEYSGTLYRSRRIYPHVHNMDGFFYCKIRKISK